MAGLQGRAGLEGDGYQGPLFWVSDGQNSVHLPSYTLSLPRGKPGLALASPRQDSANGSLAGRTPSFGSFTERATHRSRGPDGLLKYDDRAAA